MPSIPVLEELENVLVTAITHEQTRRSRRRTALRYAIRGLAVAGLALALVVPPMLGRQDGTQVFRVPPAEAQVSVVEDGRSYRIEIGNLHADPADINAALREHGLDVQVSVQPVSPSLVGVLVGSGSSEADVDRVSYEYRGRGSEFDDVVAVTVLRDYRGSLVLAVGRRAHPGEPYGAAAQSAAEPGEALHCIDIFGGAAVRELLPAIQERGVKVTWRNPNNREVPVSEVMDFYVNAAAPLAGGEVLILTHRERTGDNLTPEYRAYLRSGC